jgi:phosphotransferase system HPr-like phosphotransfer protein
MKLRHDNGYLVCEGVTIGLIDGIGVKSVSPLYHECTKHPQHMFLERSGNENSRIALQDSLTEIIEFQARQGEKVDLIIQELSGRDTEELGLRITKGLETNSYRPIFN